MFCHCNADDKPNWIAIPQHSLKIIRHRPANIVSHYDPLRRLCFCGKMMLPWAFLYLLFRQQHFLRLIIASGEICCNIHDFQFETKEKNLLPMVLMIGKVMLSMRNGVCKWIEQTVIRYYQRPTLKLICQWVTHTLNDDIFIQKVMIHIF